jgi:hypothetical protein
MRLKKFENKKLGHVYNDLSDELRKRLEAIPFPEKGAYFKILSDKFRPVKYWRSSGEVFDSANAPGANRKRSVGAKSYRTDDVIVDPVNGYVKITLGTNADDRGRVNHAMIQFEAGSGVLFLPPTEAGKNVFYWLMVSSFVVNSPLYEGKGALERVNPPKCEWQNQEREVDVSLESIDINRRALNLVFDTEDQEVLYGVALEFGYQDSKEDKYMRNFLVSVVNGGRAQEVINAFENDGTNELFAKIIDAVHIGILEENLQSNEIHFAGTKKALAKINSEISGKSKGRYLSLIKHFLSDEGISDRIRLEQNLDNISTPPESKPKKPKASKQVQQEEELVGAPEETRSVLDDEDDI